MHLVWEVKLRDAIHGWDTSTSLHTKCKFYLFSLKKTHQNIFWSFIIVLFRSKCLPGLLGFDLPAKYMLSTTESCKFGLSSLKHFLWAHLFWDEAWWVDSSYGGFAVSNHIQSVGRKMKKKMVSELSFSTRAFKTPKSTQHGRSQLTMAWGIIVFVAGDTLYHLAKRCRLIPCMYLGLVVFAS